MLFTVRKRQKVKAMARIIELGPQQAGAREGNNGGVKAFQESKMEVLANHTVEEQEDMVLSTNSAYETLQRE